MTNPLRNVTWMGSSLKDLSAMPKGVKLDFGGAIHCAQQDVVVDGAKHLKGKVAGTIQLSEDFDGETYRAVYTTEMDGYVYVLHCFQKKSKSGIQTPKEEIDVIERRLKDARILHKRRMDEKKKERAK